MMCFLTYQRNILKSFKLGPRWVKTFHSSDHKPQDEDDEKDADDGNKAGVRSQVIFVPIIFDT